MQLPTIVKTFTLFTVATLSLVTVPVLNAQALPVPTTITSTATVPQRILYVNPELGTDNKSAGTTKYQPFKTITYALQQATPNTTIQLAAGEYSQETFPLILKPGVSLQGNDRQQGQGVFITGGSYYLSPTLASQNVTIVAKQATQISGLTITNPHKYGTGIWVESCNPLIRNSTFIKNQREGILITGNAAPRIENNRFVNNNTNGLVIKDAHGEISGNLFDNTGLGIAIGGSSSPLVTDNHIRDNRYGVVLTDAAHPQLRSNIIENNRVYGLIVMGAAQVVLSQNSLQGNKHYDLLNISSK